MPASVMSQVTSHCRHARSSRSFKIAYGRRFTTAGDRRRRHFANECVVLVEPQRLRASDEPTGHVEHRRHPQPFELGRDARGVVLLPVVERQKAERLSLRCPEPRQQIVVMNEFEVTAQHLHPLDRLDTGEHVVVDDHTARFGALGQPEQRVRQTA
jgi:hypothetical protein